MTSRRMPFDPDAPPCAIEAEDEALRLQPLLGAPVTMMMIAIASIAGAPEWGMAKNGPGSTQVH
jgi:hypothetical protein